MDETVSFWSLVHLDIIKLYSKLGGEIAFVMSENAHSK